jgi:diguanylate cyclase (GGDEF)-like protein
LDPRLFISLLTPILAFVLAMAFCVLWFFRRDNTYVVQLASSYAAIGVGFLAQSFQLGLGYELSRFVSNLLFITAIYLLIRAVLHRRGLAVPTGALGGVIVTTLAATFWYTWMDENFIARVIVVNCGLGVICAIGTIALKRAHSETVMDRLIMAVIGLGMLNFMGRPVVELLLNGSGLQDPDIMSSYWLTTSLTSIVYGLLVALTVLSAAALDAIGELQAQTQTDPLSGLLNRRGFEQRGAQLLELYTATGMPVAVAMADLDHFKAINDRHGHAAGDEVIADFARCLRGAMGPNGIAGRLGGEEFAVLLPLADLNAGRLFAEAVRTALQDIGGMGVTASFGVAQWQQGEGLEQLLSRCDSALYQAKQAGRDRVRLSEDPRAIGLGQALLRQAQ